MDFAKAAVKIGHSTGSAIVAIVATSVRVIQIGIGLLTQRRKLRKAMSDIPRRIDHLRFTPAETAITEAMVAVEKAGCDPLLTEAVVLLTQARQKVADYVDREAPDAEDG